MKSITFLNYYLILIFFIYLFLVELALLYAIVYLLYTIEKTTYNYFFLQISFALITQ